MPFSYLEAVKNSASTNTVIMASDEKIRQLGRLVEQGKQAEKELERLVYERSKQAEENLRQRAAARLDEELKQRRAREEDARQYIQREQEKYDNMTPEERRKHDEEKQLWLESEAEIHREIDRERTEHERRRRCYPYLNLRPYDDPYDSEDDLVLGDETAKHPMSLMKAEFYTLLGDTFYAMELESERRGGFKRSP